MNRLRTTLPLMSLLLFCFSSELQGQKKLEYNQDIRPILAENCFACHGADSAARKGDLRLDVREAAVDAESIVPNKPEESEMIARLVTDDPELKMPPPATKKKLTKTEIETLKRWIAQGAEYQPHWSFIAPVKPELPKVKNEAWVKNEIDRFILSRLETENLSPAPEAEPHRLFRRLHLDITGLPPSPEDVKAFVNDYAKQKDAALSEWIDRLMSKPTWGEHRARYWLDAARYGDTHGLHFDNYREMYPYRDWVIRSFNQNQPFDQFTIEQLAGDLLPSPSTDQLIATGFQRCNITTNEGGTIDEENLALYAADRVQTFGWVYLGLTTNCGQCHDHKFDPFTMKDYYSLAAFFRNTTQGPKDGNSKDGRGPVIRVPREEDRARYDAIPQEIAVANAKQNERRKQAKADFEKWLASVTPDRVSEELPHKNLITHLYLNEGKGDEVNSSLEPSQTFKATGKLNWVSGGKTGSAPVLKSGSTINLGQIGDFEKNQPFSYGAWVRTSNLRLSAGIIARMNPTEKHRGWDLWQQQSNVSVHIIDSWPNNALKVTTTRAVLKKNQWHHLFATYDGSGSIKGIKIYVDGRLEPTRIEQNNLKKNASIRTKTPLRIGQRNESAVFENGSVQDFRIYDRVLSAQEVKSLHGSVPLNTILKTPPAKRTKQQQQILFDHYLASHDKEYAQLTEQIAALETEKQSIESRSPITHIQREKMNSPAMAHILIRGEYDRKSDQVKATTPAALHPMSKEAPRNRLGLAQWLVDENNPLTARVTVNRFWQEIFGRGIVVTPEDFGVMGALPTHPELLDWLAIEFQEQNWDVKQFFKMMFMSASYRQSAQVTEIKLEKDRNNLLLSRGPRFRMDAEMVRDYALSVSDLLSPKMYGPGTRPYQPVDIWEIVGLPGGDTRKYVQDKGENLYRRTLYHFWKRMAPPPNMEAFNAPSREVCTVRRERTNTPLQALVTLNDPQFVEASRNLAQIAMQKSKGTDEAIINGMAMRVLGRNMTKREQEILLIDKNDYLKYYKSNSEDAKKFISVGESKPDEKLDPATLATWTMIANQVLNLDEGLNK